MKLFVYSSSFIDHERSESICETLSKKGHVLCDSGEADLIVSLGGDGTLLKAAQIALKEDKPLLGINCGRLGYLCLLKEEEIDHFDEILENAVETNRSVLECRIDQDSYLAVNEIIVGKINFGQTVDLSLQVDEQFQYSVRGDGLIVCTPTGSTAYNLSASGPLLEEDLEVTAVTPICAHSKDIRPLVLSDRHAITIQVNHDHAGIYADGEHIGNSEDKILVSKAEKKLKLYNQRNT